MVKWTDQTSRQACPINGGGRCSKSCSRFAIGQADQIGELVLKAAPDEGVELPQTAVLH